jgi:hypothetical protein
MSTFKYRKFNLTDKQIQKIIDSIKNQNSCRFKISKKIIKSIPVKGSIKLLLTDEESEHVRNEESFYYSLTLDKIKLMSTKIKNGGLLPFVIPAIIGGITALGTAATGTAAVVTAVNQRKTDREKNEIAREHNKEIENILREGKGLFLTSKGNGLWLNSSIKGRGLYLSKQ